MLTAWTTYFKHIRFVVRTKMAEHHVREYVKRVASIDIENYPEWDLTKPLPKLPVPELKQTLDTYLSVMKSVITEEEYRRTKIIVEDFGKPRGLGEMLQEKLKKYSETVENWSYSWWLDDMYMKARLSLPINSNPGMVFPRQHFENRNQQLRYAARLISGILDYKTIIDAKVLPVDRCRHKIKGQPLCMAQYYRLFTSYRVPGKTKDCLVTNSSRDGDTDHIIVACKNQFFVLDLVLNFQRLSEDDVFTQLDRIAEMADEGVENAEYIGALTAAPRTNWATAREHLMQDHVNRASLEQIERCMFILCLDRSIPISFNHQRSIDETSMNVRDDVSLLCQMLHGQGSKVNSCNRWYDKTMQFIICQDGACGLNYEHSPSEGIAVVQLIEHLLKYMQEVHEKKLRRMQSLCELPQPLKLEWKLSDIVRTEIKAAVTSMNIAIADLDLYVLRFDHFGKEFPKENNMSPDSFIQLALQLTYYKIHGTLVSTYESASTRRFHLGRVDNIRANSTAALEWVKAMVAKNESTDEEKMGLLRKAMAWQTMIMTQTILGNGMDCHLLGLREIATDQHDTVPDIFTDETYKKSNHFTLSTSQVNTTMDTFMCYGPVVPDGYGVCYNPHPHDIIVCITAFKSNAETQSDYFAYTLEGSLLQMQELCRKTTEDLENLTEKLRNTSVKNGPNSAGNGFIEHNNVSKNHCVNVLQGEGNVRKPTN
ncbi:choline O-acetyltransferase-like [Mercenaria mercenaria]|uniref:choline O-acetyltransferase-like n=1 Tax=Mercenaria mercenaria TaxID=6596 RepID=UPI00234EBC38|nr:choline O-acetyltransferase-like [Mercenaria mercenaria]